MIKVLLPLCVIFFIVLYMVFAFANWDIAWVAHVDVIARWFFILLFVAFFLMFSAVYLESKDKH
ncbi:hypothetical protein [Prevotella corporis]|uniref:hypothetical protein n=1 Tax=Prevotella corporis TaxID=28128 RepID=UPI0023F9BE60|nr:hypothetical protein [Prevotella corporis]